MARKIETVTIETEGRDKGKVFIVTEMPATVAKKWVTQLFRAATAVSASRLTELTAGVEMAAMLDEPTFERWRECVQYQPEGSMPQKIRWDVMECQIEEISTVTLLQVKVLEAHIGFFSQGKP